MKPEWMPPLPDIEQEIYGLSRRFVGAPVQGAVRQMMVDYAIAAVEAYRKSLKPVAWGVPNSRITERQPFLSLLHQLPVEGGVDGRRKKPLYPEMLVPLYRLDGGNDDAAV